MDYINQINEDFVKEFAQDFFKTAFASEKSFEVKKCADCWAVRRIVSDDFFVKYAYIYLFDYHAESNGISFNSDKLTTLWRKKMYEKFEEKYLVDLKTNLKQKIDEQYRKSLAILDSEILSVKQGNEKSDTGR